MKYNKLTNFVLWTSRSANETLRRVCRCWPTFQRRAILRDRRRPCHRPYLRRLHPISTLSSSSDRSASAPVSTSASAATRRDAATVATNWKDRLPNRCRARGRRLEGCGGTAASTWSFRRSAALRIRVARTTCDSGVPWRRL